MNVGLLHGGALASLRGTSDSILMDAQDIVVRLPKRLPFSLPGKIS